MLVRSNNNSVEEKDLLAIGQREYAETNPFGYKDYKEKYDNTRWWKIIEYTDENGEKVEKEVNVFGQTLIKKPFPVRENKEEKKEIELDESLFDDWDFDDDWKETKKEQRYNWDDTPEPAPDENNLSENDFYKMDWKKAQYQIYRLLVNISSSLSDVKEVPKENEK